MGAGALYKDEAPRRQSDIAGFRIEAHEITNKQFARFIAETGYVTIAERQPDPKLHPDIPQEDLVPGSAVFRFSRQDTLGRWAFMPGASWRHPEGMGSTIEGKAHYPVVQIGYEDAQAYAQWAGGDLPTAEQWEYAARGGLVGQTYEWGNTKPDDVPQKRANTWQGLFPFVNTAEDGFVGLAPVGCFEANGYGLYDMTGNVWEWVKKDNDTQNLGTVKGGSFLCAENYCRRFRPAAHHNQELDLGTNHIGFRVVYPPKEQ